MEIDLQASRPPSFGTTPTLSELYHPLPDLHPPSPSLPTMFPPFLRPFPTLSPFSSFFAPYGSIPTISTDNHSTLSLPFPRPFPTPDLHSPCVVLTLSSSPSRPHLLVQALSLLWTTWWTLVKPTLPHVGFKHFTFLSSRSYFEKL